MTDSLQVVIYTLTSGEDARVHESGHTEVSQDKQEDDSIIDGHSH